VISVLQDYYKKNGIAPMVRILSKVTGYKLKYIYELFPSGPGKGACKMAGLPKRPVAFKRSVLIRKQKRAHEFLPRVPFPFRRNQLRIPDLCIDPSSCEE